MIRVSEAVLPGHPDKLCDFVAESIVQAALAVDEEAYAQIEAGIWCDQLFLTGGIVTRAPLARALADIVRATGRRIGYVAPNAIAADRYQIRDTVCQRREDPRTWTDHVNDQCDRHRVGRATTRRCRGCPPSTTSRTASAGRWRQLPRRPAEGTRT